MTGSSNLTDALILSADRQGGPISYLADRLPGTGKGWFCAAHYTGYGIFTTESAPSKAAAEEAIRKILAGEGGRSETGPEYIGKDCMLLSGWPKEALAIGCAAYRTG